MSTQHVREQNWLTVGLHFLKVGLGVFLALHVNSRVVMLPATSRPVSW